ncbi:unnamed protein product [Hyaloperonospora brassicae]|uniref:PDZ domain-containing protein n=1 Tax=Hyaloperonospora brassicae TaxID=162125 RepID=A0AAV0U790_HYABA|nr:unnamed protein product [Hyaloperonospora brassicae]
MGAALCTCGRPDDQSLSSLRFDRLAAGRAAAAVGSYGVFPPAKARQPLRVDPKSQLLSRGETYALSDDDDVDHSHNANGDDSSGELRHSRRYSTAQAYADAFRAKLQEPPLSPHSKFTLLSSRYSCASPTESSRGGDSGSTVDVAAAVRKTGQLRDVDVDGAVTAPDREQEPDAVGAANDVDDDDDEVTDDEWKQRANPLVTVIVPPGPCGLVLQLDRDERGAPVVDGFVRKPDGHKSTIENSQLVHKGSVLCAINDIDVTRMPLKEVLRTLNLSSHLERAFTFRNRCAHRHAL